MKLKFVPATIGALSLCALLSMTKPVHAQEIGITANRTAEIFELPSWADVAKQHDGLQGDPQAVDAVTRQSLEARWRTALHEHDALQQEATTFVSDYNALQADAAKLRSEAASYASACTPHPPAADEECAKAYNRLVEWKSRLQAEVDRLDKEKRDHNLEAAQWGAQDLTALRKAFGEAVAKEPSGVVWVKRFASSSAIDDLKPPFRDHVKAFLAAVHAAGGTAQVWVTLRPLERAYLMRYSWLIARGIVNPRDVAPMPGVRIDWQHLDEQGRPDMAAARVAARDMVQAYHIATPPALEISHAQGRAIDMMVYWSHDLLIVDAHGKLTAITSGPRTSGSRSFEEGTPERDGNAELLKVAATYGIFRSPSDPSHWSDQEGQ